MKMKMKERNEYFKVEKLKWTKVENIEIKMKNLKIQKPKWTKIKGIENKILFKSNI